MNESAATSLHPRSGGTKKDDPNIPKRNNLVRNHTGVRNGAWGMIYLECSHYFPN